MYEKEQEDRENYKINSFLISVRYLILLRGLYGGRLDGAGHVALMGEVRRASVS
jgi:hypothetical protein